MITRNLVRAVRELRHADLSFGAKGSEIPGPTQGWTTWAGVPVDEMMALQQLTWWSCVSLISDTIGTLPVDAFRGVGPNRMPLPSKPLLLEEPFAGIDWVEWMTSQTAGLVSRGNAYAMVVARDGLGFPTQLQPLHPDECDPRRDHFTGELKYRVAGEGLVDPFDIMHVKGLTLPGRRSLKGLDPVSYARQTVGLALAAEEFAARTFSEGTFPAGVLSSEGKAVDDDTAKKMQERWMESHANRHRKPAVLGGGLKWQSLSMNPEESQFLATIQAKRGEIAGFFLTPPHLVGDVERSTSWGTGIEEQNLQFISFGLGRWIIRWERAFTRILPRPQYVKLNVAGLLRGRLLDRYRAYLMGRQGSWLNVDDIRAKEDEPPLPDGKGQDYIMPLNYAPIPDPNAGDNQPGDQPPVVTPPPP